MKIKMFFQTYISSENKMCKERADLIPYLLLNENNFEKKIIAPGVSDKSSGAGAPNAIYRTVSHYVISGDMLAVFTSTQVKEEWILIKRIN